MTVGPELPPHLVKRKYDSDGETLERTKSRSPEGPEKRRRVLGPAPPPAALDERPEEPASDSDSSSDDDDYGPALPPAPGSAVSEFILVTLFASANCISRPNVHWKSSVANGKRKLHSKSNRRNHNEKNGCLRRQLGMIGLRVLTLRS